MGTIVSDLSNLALIKTVWTPHFTTYEMKTNKNSICEKRLGLYERVVTFEGPEYMSEGGCVGSHTLASDLVKCNRYIAHHIEGVLMEKGAVKRMVLFFKLDDQQRLWLLFCTELVLGHSPISPRILSFHIPPDSLKISGSNFIRKALKIQKPKKLCTVCGEFKKEECLVNMKFKYILESIQKESLINEKKQEQLEHILRIRMQKVQVSKDFQFKKNKSMYSTLTQQRFEKMRKDQMWMNTMVKVCEECFLSLTSEQVGIYERKMEQRRIELKKKEKRRVMASIGPSMTKSKSTTKYSLPMISHEEVVTKPEFRIFSPIACTRSQKNLMATFMKTSRSHARLSQ